MSGKGKSASYGSMMPKEHAAMVGKMTNAMTKAMGKGMSKGSKKS